MACLRSQSRSPITPTLEHQRPSDARDLVGQRQSPTSVACVLTSAPTMSRRGAPFVLPSTTPLHAMMRRRRRVRSPMREVRPRQSLPSVDFCIGLNPIQAEKSRPDGKVSTGRANASIAVAIIGPTPRMLISRRATSSRLARSAICLSRTTIFSCSSCKASTSRRRHSRAASGMSESRSRMCGISFSTWERPCGAIKPYSPR